MSITRMVRRTYSTMMTCTPRTSSSSTSSSLTNVLTSLLSREMALVHPGTLYILPTPIGNVADVTLRVIAVLKATDYILTESQSRTRMLLSHLNITGKRLIDHQQSNEVNTCQELIMRLKSGERLAMVSDAGTPCISDPGHVLVSACVKSGVNVECLPGATAFVPALIQSGLPPLPFSFVGFPPMKGTARLPFFNNIARSSCTSLLYESPHRITFTLAELSEQCGGQRSAAIVKEISKRHAETIHGTLDELRLKAIDMRGEIAVAVAGNDKSGFSAATNIASATSSGLEIWRAWIRTWDYDRLRQRTRYNDLWQRVEEACVDIDDWRMISQLVGKEATQLTVSWLMVAPDSLKKVVTSELLNITGAD